MNKIEKLKNLFNNSPDLIIRKINKGFKNVYVIYLETLCSSDRVNNYILKNLTNPNSKASVKSLLATPHLIDIKFDECESYLYYGFSIIIDGNNIYALETKADLDRSIDITQTEPAIYGPKDALVENFQKNVGLIKRRIKSHHLKMKEYKLGKYTNTITGLLYIDNIAKEDIINKVDVKLTEINTDSIIDTGEIRQFLISENKKLFPAAKLTERPDTIVKALLEGKIVIIIDTSPFALIIPAVLADFINPTVDHYEKSNNVNFLKILRILCFFITIITPAFYIAIVNYNQESIPAKLLTSFITQREGVPFPATIEAFGMLFICELLRESDIRFPNNYSSSVSVLGALILGDAAVAANLVSPIMIIITAITFISSMVFNDIELIGSIRAWRFIFLIIASIYGLYGITISLILLLVNLCSFNSFGVSYMLPIAPFDLAYLKETLIKFPRRKNKLRSKYLTSNIRKQV
jgi:spore germination protein KA